MSRRELQTNVSPDLEQERVERDALLGEKNSIQAEMISLGETNKRVKNEIKESEGKIEELSKKQSSLMGSVYKLDELISHRKDEIVNLDKIYSDKKYALEKTLPNVKNVLADLEQKKLPIQNQIDRLLLFKKEAQESLEKIDQQIKNKNKIFTDLETSVEHKSFQEGLLRKSIDKHNKELETLEEKVSKNEVIVLGIEKRQVVLANINYQISEAESAFISRKNEIKKFLEVENEEVKKEIEKNKAINEQEKVLHISLSTKKQDLDSREAFIKNQYIRAGLKYN